MKNKFHLAKRSPSRYAGPSGSTGSAAHAVALIDERYLSWLAEQQQPRLEGPIQRGALLSVFSGLARHAGADQPLIRAYVYADTPSLDLLDDVVWRTVPQHAADGGLGLVRALGLELTQLAMRGGCDMVLVASDDERLIPYIDEAQWRGLKVVLVADESAQQYGKLMTDDPSWARLLMQADRRVPLTALSWQALTSAGAVPAAHAHAPDVDRASDIPTDVDTYTDAPPSDEWRAHVQQVIDEWWKDESSHAKLDLYDEMQTIQGVPPETDRHLLLRVRRTLARTLSFPEKKAMREMIRATVMAQPPRVDEALES